MAAVVVIGKYRVVKAVKNIVFLSLLLSLLSGCYVPGTYFTKGDLSETYVADGQETSIEIVQLDKSWLEKHQTDDVEQYIVGPHDVLNVIVWDHEELTTPTTQLANPEQTGILVDSSGYIFFPYAGQIKVEGLTVSWARRCV